MNQIHHEGAGASNKRPGEASMTLLDQEAIVRVTQEVPWIVWSNEHRAFWAANRLGYSQRIERAGRYSQAEAEEICRYAAPRANSSIYEGTPPEICMPAPEALAFANQQRERDGKVHDCAFCPVDPRSLYAMLHNLVGQLERGTSVLDERSQRQLQKARLELQRVKPAVDAHFAALTDPASRIGGE